MLSIANEFAPRLEAHHRTALLELCAILGTPGALTSPGAAPTEASPWQGSVGIYTLQAEVGRHVVDALQGLYPGARVA